MSLQESLHWAVGRGRSKVAIGIHDMDTVKPPFRYIASPRNRKFIPLDYTEEMTMDEILTKHPKGRDYAKIVKDFPLFPLIIDSDDHVLSFPPIINGERTRVTIDTKNILLDTTGTDRRAVGVAVNIICTAMAEAGATIGSVEIGGVQTPTLAPAERMVSVKECSRLLGVELTASSMAELLRKMRFGAEPAGADTVRVLVPCYRADIMHDWDLFEDVAIAYGYDKLESRPPKTFTVGKPHPVQVNAALAREAFTGLGYLEVMPFTLTNEDVLYRRMRRPETKGRPPCYAPDQHREHGGQDRAPPPAPRVPYPEPAPRAPAAPLYRGRCCAGLLHPPAGSRRQHPPGCRLLGSVRVG